MCGEPAVLLSPCVERMKIELGMDSHQTVLTLSSAIYRTGFTWSLCVENEGGIGNGQPSNSTDSPLSDMQHWFGGLCGPLCFKSAENTWLFNGHQLVIPEISII